MHVFFVFSIVMKLNEHEENHEIQKSIWRYYSNENGDFRVAGSGKREDLQPPRASP